MRAEIDSQGCETPVSARVIAEYAERHNVYRGSHGVCAGPPVLIDEYLRVLLGEETAPIQVEPSVAARLGDLNASIDYGLLGQRIESVTRFLGASQGLLHERLRAAFVGHLPRTVLQERVEVPIDPAHYPLLRNDLPLVETFQRELDLSRWLFARAGEALSGKVDAASLDERVKLDPAEQATSQRRLCEFFAHGLSANKVVREPILGELAAVAAAAFALERCCLRIVEREQGTLNERLSRQPSRALTSVDLAAYTRPRNGPPLFETLAEGSGVSVTSDAAATVLRYGDHILTFTD